MCMSAQAVPDPGVAFVRSTVLCSVIGSTDARFTPRPVVLGFFDRCYSMCIRYMSPQGCNSLVHTIATVSASDRFYD